MNKLYKQLSHLKHMKNNKRFQKFALITISSIGLFSTSQSFSNQNFALCESENNSEEIKLKKNQFQITIHNWRRCIQNKYSSTKNRMLDNSSRMHNSFREFIHNNLTPAFLSVEEYYLKIVENRNEILRNVKNLSIFPVGFGVSYLFFKYNRKFSRFSYIFEFFLKKIERGKALSVLSVTPIVVLLVGYPEIAQDYLIKTLKYFHLPSPDSKKEN